MTQKFTANDIQEKFVELHGGTKKAAKDEVRKVQEVITALAKQGLAEGHDEVKIPLFGFGTYTVKPTEARKQFSQLANEGKGAIVSIPASVRVSFKPAKALKSELV